MRKEKKNTDQPLQSILQGEFQFTPDTLATALNNLKKPSSFFGNTNLDKIKEYYEHFADIISKHKELFKSKQPPPGNQDKETTMSTNLKRIEKDFEEAYNIATKTYAIPPANDERKFLRLCKKADRLFFLQTVRDCILTLASTKVPMPFPRSLISIPFSYAEKIDILTAELTLIPGDRELLQTPPSPHTAYKVLEKIFMSEKEAHIILPEYALNTAFSLMLQPMSETEIHEVLEKMHKLLSPAKLGVNLKSQKYQQVSGEWDESKRRWTLTMFQDTLTVCLEFINLSKYKNLIDPPDDLKIQFRARQLISETRKLFRKLFKPDKYEDAELALLIKKSQLYKMKYNLMILLEMQLSNDQTEACSLFELLEMMQWLYENQRLCFQKLESLIPDTLLAKCNSLQQKLKESNTLSDVETHSSALSDLVKANDALQKAGFPSDRLQDFSNDICLFIAGEKARFTAKISGPRIFSPPSDQPKSTEIPKPQRRYTH